MGRPHGLAGFLGLYIDENDLVLLEPGSKARVGERTLTIRVVRRGDKGPQVAFEEVADRNGAETLRGQDVFVSRRRTLEAGEYWPDELIGMRVETVTGRDLGRVVDVILAPAQDRLVVGESRIEVPLVGELVPKIDMEAGQIEVVDLPGLTSPQH